MRRAHGFTLVEVLIAILLFGAVVIVLQSTMANAIRSLASIETNLDLDADLRFVKGQILHIQDREELEDGGDISVLSGNQARWYAEVESAPLLDLYRLHLRIEIDTTEGEIEIREDSLYLYRPEWDQDGDREDLLFDRRQALEDRQRGRDW